MIKPLTPSISDKIDSGLNFQFYPGKDAIDGITPLQNKPLLFLVHGRGGNANVPWVFAKSFLSIDPIIVSVEAPVMDLELGGYSWWQIAKDKLINNEELLLALQAFDKFAEFFIDRHKIDRNRVYGCGFSQGGSLLGSYSVINPSFFRALAMLSSYIAKPIVEGGFSHDFKYSIQNKSTEYFLFHGDADEVVPFKIHAKTKVYLASSGLRVSEFIDSSVHKVSIGGIKAMTAWFESDKR